jgi:threonine/homoserine/homoserine lactone efflux protein
MQALVVTMIRTIPLIIAVFGVLFLLWFSYHLCLEGRYVRRRRESDESVNSTKSNHER